MSTSVCFVYVTYMAYHLHTLVFLSASLLKMLMVKLLYIQLPVARLQDLQDFMLNC